VANIAIYLYRRGGASGLPEVLINADPLTGRDYENSAHRNLSFTHQRCIAMRGIVARTRTWSGRAGK